MFFGSDWLANLYMGCFLFGLIFTSVSLFLNFGHLGGDAGGGDAGHGSGHVLGAGHDAHGPHIGGHGDVGHGGHGVDTHADGHFSSAEHIEGLSPLNLPTLLAFITWFGGAGYIFRVTLGWNGIVSGVLALASGMLGGAIMFLILSYLLSRGQTPPMRRADYYLPGTHARVISSIAAGTGTGEIVFMKGGGRRVEGARSESGEAIPRGTEVTIKRYENGLAYVQPIVTITDLPPPELARVEDTHEANTQRLTGEGAALTRDLRDQTQ